MEGSSAARICYKLQLIIDGCNGPIRFREDYLRKSSIKEPRNETDKTTNKEPGKANALSQNDSQSCRCNKVDNDDDDNDDKTILSFLRPDSIAENSQRNQLQKNNKSRKSAKGRRKKNHKLKSSGNKMGTAEFVKEIPNRLDMMPLMQKLLLSSYNNVDGTRHDGTQVFDSIVVIFDGVSITKRPHLPVGMQGGNNLDREAMEEEITRGRFWHVTSNTTNTTMVEKVTKSKTDTRIGYQSGVLTVHVTGLYEEADNVIVERIQECHSQKIEREGQPKSTDMLNQYSRSLTTVVGIRVMRRTERGAGKNRRLFQSLGLLRPESVACVFDFATSASTKNDQNHEFLDEGQHENLLGVGHPRMNSFPFGKLALDGHQTLRSIQHQNPGNVFLDVDDAIQVVTNTDSEDDNTIIVPIVVTDDVFLRQRIIHEEGYVMTFHQLWLLLMDVL